MFEPSSAGDQGGELVFADIEFTEQITIYHVPVSSLFRPARRPAAAEHRLNLPFDSETTNVEPSWLHGSQLVRSWAIG